MQTDDAPIRLVLVTGVSGAGHSTALKILEDHGFAAIDNLPIALVDPLIALEVETGGRQIAIGLDARTSGFSKTALDTLARNLRKRLGSKFRMVFVTSAHGDLMRRYNATRRQHPLGAGLSLEAAITADMERMDDISAIADVPIDTTNMAPVDMRRLLLERLNLATDTAMPVHIISFFPIATDCRTQPTRYLICALPKTRIGMMRCAPRRVLTRMLPPISPLTLLPVTY